MLQCLQCGNHRRFERREYVRHDTVVDGNDEPVDPDAEPALGDTLRERTYRCLGCDSYEIAEKEG
jgi:hypothetical protein